MIARKGVIFRVVYPFRGGWKKDCRVFRKRSSADTVAANLGPRAMVIKVRGGK
jgi:hypothetical protein